MQIEEIKNEKFTKEYKITIPFQEVNSKVEEKVVEAAKTFKMPGFREGKVPLSIVRQKVGKEETGKQIQEQISSSINNLVNSKNIVPASRPNVEVLSFNEESGLSIKIALEVLPKLPTIKWEDIEIEKIKINISDKEIDEVKNTILKEFREYKKAQDGYVIRSGDKANIDFDGKVEGKDFDGSKEEKMDLVVGSDQFLQAFEKQLIGCKADEKKSFDVVFPENYPQKDLAMKTASFEVKINSVMELEPIKQVTQEMLKKLGVESEEKLNELIKEKLNADLLGAVRMKMKKDLFDEIDKEYDFDLPQKMIDQDFEIIWKEVEKNKDKDENLKNKTDEELKAEYQKISKRRVKLGLIMAEIARTNNIAITDEELNKIVEMQANQNPQIKSKILEFYKDPENLEKIRGPMLEEKALDVVLSKVKLKEKEMTSEEFVKNILPKIREAS